MNLKRGNSGSRNASGQGRRVVLLVVIAITAIFLTMLYDDLISKGVSPYPPPQK
jgi:hypothetical protein